VCILAHIVFLRLGQATLAWLERCGQPPNHHSPVFLPHALQGNVLRHSYVQKAGPFRFLRKL